MRKDDDCCRYELAYSVQFEHLREGLEEVRNRVAGLESTLGRGVLLLVANLVGVVMMLGERLIRL